MRGAATWCSRVRGEFSTDVVPQTSPAFAYRVRRARRRCAPENVALILDKFSAPRNVVRLQDTRDGGATRETQCLSPTTHMTHIGVRGFDPFVIVFVFVHTSTRAHKQTHTQTTRSIDAHTFRKWTRGLSSVRQCHMMGAIEAWWTVAAQAV